MNPRESPGENNPDRNPLVNALIGGAQKCGTTALFTFLADHHQIVVPKQGKKELHYFDNESAFRTLPGTHDAYERRFPDPSEHQICIEATPIYLYWEPAASRIAEYNPAIRLIFLVRDPVERAYSQWRMEFSRGTEKASFEACIEFELNRISEPSAVQDRVRSYLTRGFYAAQVSRFLEYFPAHQILVLRQDALLLNHQATLDTTCDFLQIDRYRSYPKNRLVRRKTIREDLPQLPTSLAGPLRSLFREDLLQLQSLTGTAVDDWLDR